jgi:lipopolysaccharide biosynthesis glycosyltransferase
MPNKPVRNAVMICVDNRMMVPALFVADRVLHHARHGTGEPFDMVIFNPDETSRAEFGAWCDSHGIQLRHDVDRTQLHDLPLADDRLSLSVFDRVVLPRQLKDTYDRILWLDADLHVRGDVSGLFRLDLGAAPIAAVPLSILPGVEAKAQKDALRHMTCELGMENPGRFFNAGVVLVDTANYSALEVGERAVEFYRRNAASCPLMEEHALNATLDGNIAALSPIWNVAPFSTLPLLRSPRLEPVIVHYMGPVKPWQRFGYWRGVIHWNLSEGARAWRQFLRATPWSGWMRAQWTWTDVVRSVRHDIWRIRKRLTGPSADPSCAGQAAGQQQALRQLEQYILQRLYVDVEQGLVQRNDQVVRLAGLAKVRDDAGILLTQFLSRFPDVLANPRFFQLLRQAGVIGELTK